MNILKSILKTTAIAVVVVTFGACEDDFSTVGSEIIGGNDFNTEPYTETELTAYSKKINSVQTNGLPQYLLGVYTDPVYGISRASILSQLSLSSANPEFGTEPTLDSVVLELPYYSTVEEQTEDATTYSLDSVYGGAAIKLSVYKSNYFLRELDPESNFEDPQLYYSDQTTEFENHLGPLLAEENISPDNAEITITERVGAASEDEQRIDTLKLSPRIRMHLPVDFFQQNILDKEGSQELLSNANFQSYFRGLYLKAEAVNNNGFTAALNLASENAKVIMYYTSEVDDPSSDNPDDIILSYNRYELPFGSNVVNVYRNDFQIDLSNQDMENGEPNLYLKGGQGSMVVVELFSGPDSDGDGVSDQLEDLREKDWLINEANLTFVVNKNMVPEGEKEPERIYIYNLETNLPLLDYGFDFSANDNDPLNSRIVHLGRLTTDDNGNRYYKVRLTGHIRDLINLDSTNVKLGLSVSQNVNVASMLKLKNAEEETVSQIPVGSVISPEGTVLYGNNAPNEEKKLKLNIFYTKPE